MRFRRDIRLNNLVFVISLLAYSTKKLHTLIEHSQIPQNTQDKCLPNLAKMGLSPQMYARITHASRGRGEREREREKAADIVAVPTWSSSCTQQGRGQRV